MIIVKETSDIKKVYYGYHKEPVQPNAWYFSATALAYNGSYEADAIGTINPVNLENTADEILSKTVYGVRANSTVYDDVDIPLAADSNVGIYFNVDSDILPHPMNIPNELGLLNAYRLALE